MKFPGKKLIVMSGFLALGMSSWTSFSLSAGVESEEIAEWLRQADEQSWSEFSDSEEDSESEYLADAVVLAYQQKMISPTYDFEGSVSCFLLARHMRDSGENYKEVGTQALFYYLKDLQETEVAKWPVNIRRHLRDVYQISERNKKARDWYQAALTLIGTKEKLYGKKSAGLGFCRPGFCETLD